MVPLYILLPTVFAFMVFFVGGYVYFLLAIMRADQKDIDARKDQGYSDDLVPKKLDKDKGIETGIIATIKSWF